MIKYTERIVQALSSVGSEQGFGRRTRPLGTESGGRLPVMAMSFRFLFWNLQQAKCCAFVSSGTKPCRLKYNETIAVHRLTSMLMKTMLTDERLPEVLAASLHHAAAELSPSQRAHSALQKYAHFLHMVRFLLC